MTDLKDFRSTAPLCPNRRALLVSGLAGFALQGCAKRQASPRPVLKIGDQRGGVHALMTAARALEGAPYNVDWIDMPAAAPLLESLSAGAVDLGSVGGAPFAFAYANGAKVKAVLAARIVNADPAAGRSAAILVPGHSPLRAVADLRGRKLSTVKGSAGHETALRIFEHAGIDPKSVQFVFLNNGDSKAALGSGAVDAWSTWGTYVGIAVEENGDRVLADASPLVRAGRVSGFQVASDKALREKRAVIHDFLKRYIQAREWARAHVDDYAAQIAKETGVPLAVARYSTAQVTAAEFAPFDADLLADQRATLQRYVNAGVIDKIPPLDQSGYDFSFNDLTTPARKSTS